MQAVVFYEYGSPDVLQLDDVARPVPRENEVLVKVHAAALNAADWHLLRATPFIVRLVFGLFRPKKLRILGADVAGVIEAVGNNVTQFKPGDAVFGDISASGFGGYAEYVCAPANAFALKPSNLSFEEAAAVPLAAGTALQALRDKGQIKKGSKVLINGASGGVGTFAVQLAKVFGAEVTAVCGPSKAEMMHALGADHVIDYTKEDFTQDSKRYDLIVAANGYHPLSRYKRVLSENGTYVQIGGTNKQLAEALLLGPMYSAAGNKKFKQLMAEPNQGNLLLLKELLESGKIKPVIDRYYTLREVPDAIRYLEEGHAKGKIVIRVSKP